MDLSSINLNTLTEQEQAQLYPFYHAYTREYPPLRTWREMKADGYTRVEYTKCGLDEIQETMDEIDVISSFHINEDGEITAGEGERATWLQRKINAWGRTKEWKL